MKIKTRFQLVVVLFVVISIIFGASIFLTVRDMDEAMEKDRIAQDIVKDVFELNILSNDYIMYHEERPKSQWQLKCESLETLLIKALEEFEGSEEHAVVEKIYQTQKSLETIFSRLVANYEQNFTAAENSTYSELEQRLTSQLSINSLTMVTEAFQLSDVCEEDVASAQDRVYLYTMIAVVILCAIMVIASFWVSRSVLKPITRLQKGIEIIAKGNLDHKIENRKQDEIGDLARSYENMRVKIKKRTTALKVKNKQLQQEITERKRLEEEREALEVQLRQGQKLESIGTLASGVAHEINNPLMGIINYADLINNRVQDESIKEFSEGIIEEGRRVDKIVKNLLSFARQDKESHSPALIRDIINSAVLLVGSVLRKDQITLDVDIPKDLPKVVCRSQQIEQVVINLLTNARDALNARYKGYHEDKIICISTRPFERQDANWIRTTVEDHGVGIPKKVLERIFDPFFTTKSKDEGTGLGLSVSYGIIKEHRGHLSVESKEGKYTRFHIDLLVDNGWTKKNSNHSSKQMGAMHDEENENKSLKKRNEGRNG